MIPYLYKKSYHGTGNQIGALPYWIELTVTEERNGEFFLEGSLPVGALNVEALEIDRIITASPAPGIEPQPFRIRELSKPRDAEEVHVRAQHVSYQLTENFVKPTFGMASASAQDILNYALNYSGSLTNHVVPALVGSFQFESDIVKSAAVDIGMMEPVSVRGFLGGENGSMIAKFGGELQWDGWTVRLLQARGTVRDVSIAYAKNMESLEYSTDANSLITGFYGWWRDSENAFFTDTLYMLPSASSYAYGRIQVVDLSNDLTPPAGRNTPTDDQMEAAITAYANARDTDHLTTSITVTAIPDELNGVYLCDTVTVIHPGYQLKQPAKIVKTVFNPIAERYTSLTIGTIKKSITDTILQVYARRVENELTNH